MVNMGFVGQERAVVSFDAVDVDTHYVAAGYEQGREGHDC